MPGIPGIPLKHFRANVSRTSGAAISDDGGEYGHGYITGLSVITRGEASGHDMWIDADFLSDVTAAGNAAMVCPAPRSAPRTRAGCQLVPSRGHRALITL